MRKGNVTAEEILRGAKGRLDDIGRTLNGGIEAAYAGVPSGWRGKPTNVDSELFDTAQKIVRGRSPTDGNRVLAEAGDGSGAGGGGRAGGTEAESVGEKELVKNPDGTMEFSGAGSRIRFDSLDDFVNNPKMLEGMDPIDFYSHLSQNGYNPTPLSRGSTGGIPFEQGGGFKVNWGGDRILQYHPGGGVHSGSYWKISSGTTGTIKIPISGTYNP